MDKYENENQPQVSFEYIASNYYQFPTLKRAMIQNEKRNIRTNRRFQFSVHYRTAESTPKHAFHSNLFQSKIHSLSQPLRLIWHKK